MLHEALLCVDSDTKQFLSTKNLLHCLREEVLQQVKGEVQTIITGFQQQFESTLTELLGILTERLGLDKRTRTTQTEIVEYSLCYFLLMITHLS